MDGQLRREAVIYASVYGVLFCLVSAQLPVPQPSSSPPSWIPGLSLACWHVVCMSIAPIGATPPVATALRHTPAAVASKRAITTQQSDTVPTLAQACGLSLLLSLQPRPITVPSRAVHVARALRFACGA